MISVCIPVKNGGDLFRDNLQRLKQQRVSEPVEFVVLDSGSEDETVETARALGARVYSIPPREFNHGESRNRLAELAGGDVLVFTVQDATPVGDNFLQELVRPLKEDPTLAGVYGQQIPRSDADPVTRWEIELNNRCFSIGQRKKRISSGAEFLQLDLTRRLDAVTFDNTCSSMPRKVWQDFRFSRIEFAEDIDWAFRVLTQGGVIFHNPAAFVYHSHCYTPFSRLRRHFISEYVIRRIVQMPPGDLPGRPYEELAAIYGFAREVGRLCQRLMRAAADVSKIEQPRNPMIALQRLLRKLNQPALNRFAFSQLPGLLRADLRVHFDFLVKEILAKHVPMSAEKVVAILRQIEAYVIGDFLGQYYYSLAARNGLAFWQKEMVRILLAG
jgi:rhamnosyltransferase